MTEYHALVCAGFFCQPLRGWSHPRVLRVASVQRKGAVDRRGLLPLQPLRSWGRSLFLGQSGIIGASPAFFGQSRILGPVQPSWGQSSLLGAVQPSSVSPEILGQSSLLACPESAVETKRSSPSTQPNCSPFRTQLGTLAASLMQSSTSTSNENEEEHTGPLGVVKTTQLSGTQLEAYLTAEVQYLKRRKLIPSGAGHQSKSGGESSHGKMVTESSTKRYRQGTVSPSSCHSGSDSDSETGSALDNRTSPQGKLKSMEATILAQTSQTDLRPSSERTGNSPSLRDHPAASPHGGAHGHPGFSGFPEAISSGNRKITRRNRYQSSCLAETKRLTYHTPGSEPRLLRDSRKYESFVLDSPLHKKQIKIVDKETVIHDKSDVAPVAYLRLNKLSLTKAKALDLALIRYFVMTHSKENGDEVEDLHPDTKGVSVAAINSTYRKERLENFSGVEAFITGFCDEILDISREIFVAVVICVYYFGSLPTVTYGGTYVIPFLDEYGVSLSVLFIVVCEMIAVCCFYGMRRFSEDIRLMLCFYPGLYWRVCWICCPFFIRFISALALISASFKPLVMEGYTYPIWSVYLGWIFRLLSCLSVPVYIVYLFCITKGSFFQRVKLCITAQQRAGSMNSTCPSLVAGNPGGTALAVDDRGNYHLVNLRSLIQSSLKFLLGGLIFLNLITCGSGAEITLKVCCVL
ncbi:sodium:neurotransmitter symporter family domain-containing protein [Ditylenchus destructor]|uniref:Sodium:neurotransmitter symporter family domain-containing protein n=1 Tax=Ditylenchus destructor TaxID=166010 RepID=A0AAD4R109_9BILA|nr:sodium:neurotransmitter symporter family domain-containing protein [Ditylenchus destructor]